MLRVEVSLNPECSSTLWRLQLILNVTRQKSTQTSPLNLLVGVDGVTPLIRSAVRDLAIDCTRPDREAWRELCRTRASELQDENRKKQDQRVNQNRRSPRLYKVNDLAFVIKYSQSAGKLDPGMRGPYKVTKVLPGSRYELKLLAGGYGKLRKPRRSTWCRGRANGVLRRVYRSSVASIGIQSVCRNEFRHVSRAGRLSSTISVSRFLSVLQIRNSVSHH